MKRGTLAKKDQPMLCCPAADSVPRMKRHAWRVGLALKRELPFAQGKHSLHVLTSLHSVSTQMWHFGLIK